MSERLLSTDVFSCALEPGVLDPGSVRRGAPVVAERRLGEVAGVEVGLWQLTEGTVTDTEADEIFVVLSGRGTVTFEDGARVDLAPGVAVSLRAGERTTWEIRETLRKIYVA